MKVTITLDDELMQRLDTYADRNYMSRSGLISYAVTEFLNTKEVLTLVKSTSLAMQKIADTGTVDNETIEQLEEFQRFAKMLTATLDK